MGQRRRREPLPQGCALPLFPESDGRQLEYSPVAKGHKQTAHHSKSRSFETRRSVPLISIPLLILFTETLDVRFAVRIEEFLAAFLPRRFEFGSCDVPVRPAFLGHGT